MLYCPECGAVLSDGAQFCYRCKARISVPAQESGISAADRPQEEETVMTAVPDLTDASLQTADMMSGQEEQTDTVTETEIGEAAPEEVPFWEIPFETIYTKELPDENVTEEEIPAEEISDETAVPEEQPVEELPDGTFTEEEITAEDIPDVTAVSEETPVGEKTDEIVPTEELSGGVLTEENVPAEESPADEADPVSVPAVEISAGTEAEAEENAEMELLNMLEELRPSANRTGPASADDAEDPFRDLLFSFDLGENTWTETEEEPVSVQTADPAVETEEVPETQEYSIPETEEESEEVPETLEYSIPETEEESEEVPETLEYSIPETEEETEEVPAEEDADESVFYFDAGPEDESDTEETEPEADAEPETESVFEPLGDTEDGISDEQPVTEEIFSEEEPEDIISDDDTPEETDSAPEEEEVPAADETTETRIVFTRDRSEDEETTDRSAVVRALYSRELTVDRPIRTEEVVSEKSEVREARKRKRISLIAAAVLTAVICLSAVFFYTRPDNVYARHMKKAQTALADGDTSAAAVALNKALEVRPDSLQASEVLDLMWERTCSEADGLVEEGKFSDAAEAAQELKLIHPSDSEGYAGKMEEIYTAWVTSAAFSGSSDEVSRVLELSKSEIGQEAYSRVESIAKNAQVRSRYAEFFSENSEKILDSYFEGKRAEVFDILSGMKDKVAAYLSEGGTLPVISEAERAGRHVAYYLGSGDMFQVYIGKLTDEAQRIGTADSFVISSEGGKDMYEYYTCEWDKDAPGGTFSHVRYGDKVQDDVFTYSGKLKNGVYDGPIDIADSEGTVYKTKFENGKVILEMEVSPGGVRNVVGWDEYRVWMLNFSDEDVQRTFALPYVQ